MKNVEWAQAILQQLFAAGVMDVIICPGARNAPFVEVLAHWESGVRLHSFFEERSAGFFALGRAAESGRPAAVITTSGTAVANLLPAVVEAHYSGLPLVVISADRPKAYRGTGAPQTIVQPGLFTEYAHSLGDLEAGELIQIPLASRGPSHLNVCFDEPLIDAAAATWTACKPIAFQESKDERCDSEAIEKFAQETRRPLILVGGLPEYWRRPVLDWLSRQNCPMYLEASSGLRAAPELAKMEIFAGERTLKMRFFDGVLRIGHVPTARTWRDLEKMDLPVLSLSQLPFPGLARKGALVLNLAPSLFERSLFSNPETAAVIARDREEWRRFQYLLEEFPFSEMAWMRRISEQIQARDRVYLGNSLPIREWDLAARRNICFETCFANRGANGIDGQLSTFFGWARERDENWAVLGDLTTMYDLSAPWALRSRRVPRFRLVVINNGGGKIFQPMFREKLFENRHEADFRSWAEFWRLNYQLWDGSREPAHGVLEVRPDAVQTEGFQSAW